MKKKKHYFTVSPTTYLSLCGNGKCQLIVTYDLSNKLSTFNHTFQFSVLNSSYRRIVSSRILKNSK